MAVTTLAPSETTVEAGGHAKGVAAAVVCENKDDSGLGRVKVRYPWHSQPTSSYWARVATPMAGKSRGVYIMPEVGDEVLVAFDRGDVRFPYVIGSLWNGVDRAPTTNADGENNIRQIKTGKGHTLTFDDGRRGAIRLELSDGKKLQIDDDGISLDDGKGNKLVVQSQGGSISIDASTSLSLKAPKISIEATGTLDIKATAALTLQGTPVKIN